MKNKSWKTLILLALLLLLPIEMFGAEIAVIGHKDFPKDTLSISEVKKVYLGRKTEEGGIQIKPLDQMDESSIKKAFIRKILGASLRKYKAHWVTLVFREGGALPRVMPTSKEVLEAVRNDPGAIGYLLVDELAKTEGVKVLLKLSTSP